MQQKMANVFKTVLERVTPKETERGKIDALAKKLAKKVVDASKASGIKAKVRLEGSVAKDTWLREDPEIDIFMRVSKTMPRSSLGGICLKIARKATRGSKQIENFAEHPYLEAVVDSVTVNIVPCYDVKLGEWLSATDRTPYHTDYVKKVLNEHMRGEVRLMKKFMKGIDVYGAEIKVGGFSGYLCELLILNFGSFANTLKAFAQYKKRVVADIENYYRDRENELQLLFKEPLVIVDPVDRGRNVASAVRPEKLYTFAAAARAFLKNPNLEFFYPRKTAALAVEELKREFRRRGSTIIFLTFGKINAVPDVLWGQLYKSQRSLRKLVQLNDFKILRELAWSDEEDLSMFMFELEQRCISAAKKHLGPPLEKEKECEKFLMKYSRSPDLVSGPYVEDGRWVVLVRRKFTDVCELLKERLKDGGRNAGVAEGISHILRKGFRVLVNEEIVPVYERNSKFATFLTGFLSGKPGWLETA